ncbi:hypothetical protein MUP95_02120, partial [bacterium]|nr:hypothetical protein [bacterium]
MHYTDSSEFIHVRKKLIRALDDPHLLWHYYPKRHDRDDVIETSVKGVCPANEAQMRLKVERFIGGGFAGQVYRVRLLDIQSANGTVEGLRRGGAYAVKIGKPPSPFALWFRNLLYRIAYQASFAPQLIYPAVRSGVLWQKLIRRGALVAFGSEAAAVDTYGTFYDSILRSWGEINEWIEGRNWKFEIDDCVFRRKKNSVESSEYLSKRFFMNRMVQLCHDMGAYEFARQYEWWTAKSQPNVLKRLENSQTSSDGLIAIDFRAGLVLLPFFPMSPADFKLILEGAARGNLVQFDRGDLNRLERFILCHRSQFEDILPAFEELKSVEKIYRSSLTDITHHGVRIFTDPNLGRSIVAGTVESWHRQNFIDDVHVKTLCTSPIPFGFFALFSIVPFIGKFVRRLSGNRRYAAHIKYCLFRRGYLYRYLKVKQAGILLEWQRSGRACDERILRLLDRPVCFWIQHFLFRWLPSKWHRFFAEPRFAWNRISHVVSYPVKLYFDSVFREKWLTDMVEEGRREGMLTNEEEKKILNHM